MMIDICLGSFIRHTGLVKALVRMPSIIISMSIIDIYCIYVIVSVSWRVAQYNSMPIHYTRWKFHEHGIHACKWNIFMTAKLISEKYFEMKNSNSTHGNNIAHFNGFDMVKSTEVRHPWHMITDKSMPNLEMRKVQLLFCNFYLKVLIGHAAIIFFQSASIHTDGAESLRRIYGISFPDAKQLADWEKISKCSKENMTKKWNRICKFHTFVM